MDPMQENLDAYRVLADLLAKIRDDVFTSLKRVHGDAWYEHAPFEPIIERLITRKEAEASIDWHTDEYQELIRFCDFTDLLAFIETEPELVPSLRGLAPSSELLHTRFLELETLRRKLSLARPITESELAYLTAFHRRYQNRSESPSVSEQGSTEVPPPPGTDSEPERIDSDGSQPSTEPPKPEARPTPSESGALDDQAPTDQKPTAPKLSDALEEGDERAILRHLYNEVTELSDDLFDPDETTYPTAWPVVRRSSWYESSFSELGLRPLSNFYEVFDRAVEYKTAHGNDADMHAFLKDHDFARVLLELRDMFQKIGV